MSADAQPRAVFREPSRPNKVGIILLFILLVGYFGMFFGYFAYSAIDNGYGTGLSNQSHVSDKIAEQNGFEPGISAKELAEKTNVTDGGGVWHDTWRILLSLGLVLGIIFFYYAMLSRLGSF